MNSGKIESTIAYVGKQVSKPLVIRFSGGYLDGSPDAEPYESLLKHDIYLMQYDVESNSFKLLSSKPEGENFRSLENATSFNDITAFINEMNKDAYMWLDILVGVLLRYNDIENIPENEREEWTAEIIWDKVLKHFLPWFK